VADFQYNPETGWLNEDEFPDYPTAPEVRPMFQRLFDQIRDAFNAHKAEEATDAHTPANVGIGTVNTDFKRTEVKQPKIKDYSEVVVANAAASGVVTIDLSQGNVFNLTVTGVITGMDIINPAPIGQACSFTLKIAQGATPYAITFPVPVKWVDDIIPNLTTANKVYDLVFSTIDGGAIYHGGFAGKYSA
jgi:uncharacterized protein YlxP (DUF503 family)